MQWGHHQQPVKAGSLWCPRPQGRVLRLFDGSVCFTINHHPVMEQGLLEEEAQALLQEFFAGLRAKRLKLKAEKRAQQAAPLQNEENPHE